jgi:hypothetical protein
MKTAIISRMLWTISISTILFAACTASTTPNSGISVGASTVTQEATAATESMTDISEPSVTPELTSTPGSTGGQAGESDHEICDLPFENADPLYFSRFWPNTNFCNINVDPSEIFIGIVSKDAIPALDNPIFLSIEQADMWLQDSWPIMRFEHEGDVRGYPLVILIWHEIVNDVVGGLPVSLTFCPLCNATIAFDRTLADGTILEFGTTGNLRNSDLVMYDRQTESWWQQFTGEAIIGDLMGTTLEFLPSQIIRWRDFKSNDPDAQVLSRETGHSRPYGQNPYPGYDDINSSPWFPGLGDDERLPAMERVVAVEINEEARAYPFEALKSVLVINDVVGSSPIVVFWKAGTSSTFGFSIQDVGSTGVFSSQLDDQVLSFKPSDDASIGGFEDLETGSFWNIFGEAESGPLDGSTLTPVVSGEHFWFAWSVFLPETDVWEPKS